QQRAVMNIDLKGKVAIVTGAGRGIGREIARTLAAEGVVTTVTDIRQKYLEDVAREWRENGWQGTPYRCDVRDFAAITAMVEAIDRERGRIDLLVNNAGVALSAPIEEMTEEAWDLNMD